MQLLAQVPSSRAFAPFGEWISAPAEPGARVFYTDWLGSDHPGATPRLHVNSVLAVMLPHRVTVLERHPHAAQIFLPLEVHRYLVVAAPSLPDGTPALAGAQAFIVPGNLGVVYRKGTWHASAMALDRTAHFAVSMWRNDRDDDEFVTLAASLHIGI